MLVSFPLIFGNFFTIRTELIIHTLIDFLPFKVFLGGYPVQSEASIQPQTHITHVIPL
jgi:hypothetical protein